MNDPDPRPSGLSHPLKRLMSRIFGRSDEKEDLLEQLRVAEAHAIIDAEAVSMMEGVLQVSVLSVRDLMVPRAQMDVIDINASLDEILNFVRRTAHSRFPVMDGDRDNIVGILLAKDLLHVLAQDEPDIPRLLRPVVFVPETQRLNLLLRDFRRNHNHLAMVVDEYGGVSGLITIEDILEQIVGDIEDEHDTDEASDNIVRLPHEDGRCRVKAVTTLEQFNEVMSGALSHEDVDTIGGYLTNHLGRVPRRGERVSLNGFEFEVQRANARMVQMLIVRPSALGLNEEQSHAQLAS